MLTAACSVGRRANLPRKLGARGLWPLGARAVARLALALAAKVGPGAADAVKAAAVAPGAAAFEVVVLRPALTVNRVATPDAGARVAYPYAAIFPAY